MSYRSSILQAAKTLFSEKGFKDTSIAELSKLTGAADGTIFYHFKNKEDILLQILDEVSNNIVREVDESLNSRSFQSGLEMVEEVINLYFKLAEKMESDFMLLFRNYPYQLANVNPECRNYLESIYNSFIDILVKGIRQGQEDGSITDVPPERTALILFSMINGLVRLNLFRLFPVNTVYPEVLKACHKILTN